jgi:hypothetical protein
MMCIVVLCQRSGDTSAAERRADLELDREQKWFKQGKPVALSTRAVKSDF